MIVERAGDAPVGVLLQRQVEATKPDLVVMGLYGRPRLQELILGGVSRHMLERLAVPILVSH